MLVCELEAFEPEKSLFHFSFWSTEFACFSVARPLLEAVDEGQALSMCDHTDLLRINVEHIGQRTSASGSFITAESVEIRSCHVKSEDRITLRR